MTDWDPSSSDHREKGNINNGLPHLKKREAPLRVYPPFFCSCAREETTEMARHRAMLALLLLFLGARTTSAEMHLGILVRVMPFFLQTFFFFGSVFQQPG